MKIRTNCSKGLGSRAEVARHGRLTLATAQGDERNLADDGNAEVLFDTVAAA